MVFQGLFLWFYLKLISLWSLYSASGWWLSYFFFVKLIIDQAPLVPHCQRLSSPQITLVVLFWALTCLSASFMCTHQKWTQCSHNSLPNALWILKMQLLLMLYLNLCDSEKEGEKKIWKPSLPERSGTQSANLPSAAGCAGSASHHGSCPQRKQAPGNLKPLHMENKILTAELSE